MQRMTIETQRRLEALLNEALRDVALEIRSIDALGLVSDIHRLAFANLGDLVHSAAELHFRPEALIFSYSGDVRLTWFSAPVISLDLELHAAGIEAFFSLILEAMGTHVALKHLSVDGAQWTEQCDEPRLERAIAAARVGHGCCEALGNQPRTSLRA